MIEVKYHNYLTINNAYYIGLETDFCFYLLGAVLFVAIVSILINVGCLLYCKCHHHKHSNTHHIYDSVVHPVTAKSCDSHTCTEPYINPTSIYVEMTTCAAYTSTCTRANHHLVTNELKEHQSEKN